MRRQMFLLLFALCAALSFRPALAARTNALPPPEPSAFADAESTTNVVLSVDRARLLGIGFEIELSPSTTNCLEIALGADSDGDGELSPEEADALFGYDCGEWFMRDGDGAETCDVATGGRPKRRAVFPKRAFRPEWNLVRITRRGSGDLAESLSSTVEHEHFMFIVR